MLALKQTKNWLIDRLGPGALAWWVAPAAVLLAVTVLFRLTELDLAICGMFYGGDARWPWDEAEPWRTLYDFGPYPGLVVGVGGVLLALLSPLAKRWRSWGVAGLFLAVSLFVGPGVLVNAALKPRVARPRPIETVQFGGQYEFVRVLDFGSTDHTKSFPSGHASMGFYLMAPAFLFLRRHPRWAVFFVLLGLTAGGLIGVGRVIQGRHFLSDVLWSGGLVYYSMLLVAAAMGYLRTPQEPAETPDSPVILSFEAAHASLAKAKAGRDKDRRKAA